MHTRLAWTASIVLAAALFAACGPGGPSSPGLGQNTAPATGQATAPSSMAPGGSVSGDAMATFCDEWATQVAAAWPPDATTAATLAPMFSNWAQSPAFATVGADLTTVGTWLTAQAGSTTMAAPDAATTEAYNRIVTFATANC
jgi:hypothetical protein